MSYAAIVQPHGHALLAAGFCYPNTMRYTASPILSLPHEVAEMIALAAAKQGFPTAIASLAQTCRSFRNLIYRPSDTHLWREIVLTTFDDPRKLYFASKREHILQSLRIVSHQGAAEFDWGLEFQQRILAESYFKHAIRPVNFAAESVRVRVRRHTSVWYQSAPLERSVQALSALLDVCETTAPCHPDFGPVIFGEDNDSTSGKVILWRPLAHIDTLGMASRAAPLFAMHIGGPSLNILWLESVLERGLPWSLVAKLCGKERDPEWDQILEAQLLAKLITYTGFIDFKAGGVDEDNVPISRDDQRTFSRYRAREVVYNMAYLDARRHWGPYLLVEQDDKSVSTDTKTGPPGSNDYRFEDEETEASGEYMPFAGTPQLNITDTKEAPDASQAAADMLQYNSPVPTPKQISPDWAWLAAARIVLQANMEDPRMDRLDEFLRLDRWREQGWTRPDDNVRELSLGCEVGAAWDWAGVEGVWRYVCCLLFSLGSVDKPDRRCMCWINYSELNCMS